MNELDFDVIENLNILTPELRKIAEEEAKKWWESPDGKRAIRESRLR